jgi:hypothetical protein
MDSSGEGRRTVDTRRAAPVSGTQLRAPDEPPLGLELRKVRFEWRKLVARPVDELKESARALGVRIDTTHFARDGWGDEELLESALLELLRHEVLLASRGRDLTLLTTPGRVASELRVIAWSSPPRTEAARTPAPPVESETTPGVLRAQAIVEAHGGTLQEEGWPGADAVCVRLPNAG